MNILMLCEYFFPFDRGGSEWSTYYLSEGVIKAGNRVLVVTPNYGSKSYQVWRKIPIYRFWFPIKLKRKGEAITPFWQTNILWFLLTLWAIFKATKKNQVDIIHVQGKYFLPAAILLGKFKKIPVVATIRDYQILCPIGYCLNDRKEYKMCSIKYFIQNEPLRFIGRYHHNMNIVAKLFLCFATFRLWFISIILRWFIKRSNKVVVISQKMKHIFSQNSINCRVIYNTTVFKLRRQKKENLIVFVGRLTWGKGVHLLIPATAPILKEERRLRLIIIGDGLLKTLIKKQTKKYNLSKQVTLTGHLPYKKTISLLSKAKIAVIPSVWEEPFGRVALESLTCYTPVVATNRGGLPEIVEDRKTGFIVEPTVSQLAQTIKRALKENKKLHYAIKARKGNLQEKFYKRPIRQYLELYQNLLKPQKL